MIELKNVTYTYPYQEKAAVKNLNIKVNPGEIAVVTGISGCGKSTLIRLVNGLCPHYFGGELSGTVEVCGHNIKDLSIGDVSSFTGSLFQDPEQQFFALNVDDELAFALECKGFDPDYINQEIRKVAEELNFSNVLTSSVNHLSEGQKQKVGLATILLQKVKVIILDEPTANLDVETTDELAEKLLNLKKQGYTILIVDHRLYWTKEIADKYIVMSYGEIVKEGGYTILQDSQLRSDYGLRNIVVENKQESIKDYSLAESKCIVAENINFAWKNKNKIFQDVSFYIPHGITAILGHNGAGKTTLARILTGLNQLESGSININGRKIDKAMLLKTASLVLQNADFQLYMRSAYEEIFMSIDITHKDMTLEEKDKMSLDLLEKFDLLRLKDRHPYSLSGGEKQRLVIACAVAKEPDVIILDEPTSGLDGRNMQRIADILEDLASNGTAVIVITHDLELMNKICRYALRLPVTNKLNKQAV